MLPKTAKANQSVEKTFQIIEAMAMNKHPMRLQEISQQTGMPASTALRLLNTLVINGYIKQSDETLKYALSLKFLRIGSIASSQISIRDVVRPYLIELSKRCQEATCLAIEEPESMEVVYIDVVEGPDNMLRTMQRIGKRAPLHSTGVGKNILLNYTPEKISQMIMKKGLPALTPYTLISQEALMAELEKVRIQGYAMDNEECEIGARCISAPIRDYTGLVTASISISGPTSRMTAERVNVHKNVLIEIAKRISSELAYPE